MRIKHIFVTLLPSLLLTKLPLLYCTVSVLLSYLLLTELFLLRTNATEHLQLFSIMVAAFYCFTVSALIHKNLFMSIAPYRLFIFPSDVTALHDCSKSTASRKLTELKEATGKAKHHEVTIAEYCEYYGLNYENICKFLNLVK